ncbi:DinB family protein [Aquimarina sp. W85]|uniref:DinB family protein n=1 Tax=Aquimarina rhodophyticola TaxID=3342246 RepID=UPI00366FB8C8
MNTQLEITRVNRSIFLKFLDQFSLAQLNTIPSGFSNNIIWNIAHVVVTQQLLVYKLSGNNLMVSQDLVDRYRKGTKAEDPVNQQEVDLIKKLLVTTIDTTEQDLDMLSKSAFEPYPTSTGFTLKSIKDAISFNTFHEGIHLGYILALKKSI